MIKILVRSRSLRFMADIVRQSPTSSLARLRWSGQDIFYRSGSADPFVLYQVLLRSGKKAEYYVPPGLRPKIILDIGSNIGASIIYFHRQFPDANIFGFEPHPDTFRVLQKMSRICMASRFSTTASERLINALRSALIR